jgi:hypothetical protein
MWLCATCSDDGISVLVLFLGLALCVLAVIWRDA